jgi:hypothetical protein
MRKNGVLVGHHSCTWKRDSVIRNPGSEAWVWQQIHEIIAAENYSAGFTEILYGLFCKHLPPPAIYWILI